MDWVNSSIQLGRNLLDSVDQKAAISLREENLRTLSESKRQDKLNTESNISEAAESKKHKIPNEDNEKLSSNENEINKTYIQEIRSLKAQLAISNERISVYENELKHLEKEYKAHIKEYDDNLNNLSKLKDDEKNNYIIKLKDMEISNGQLSTLLKNTQEEKEKNERELNKIMEKLKEYENMKLKLWEHAVSQPTVADAEIQKELNESNSIIKQLKDEYIELKKKYVQREEELKNENSQLSMQINDLITEKSNKIVQSHFTDSRGYISEFNNISGLDKKKYDEEILKFKAIIKRETEKNIGIENEKKELEKNFFEIQQKYEDENQIKDEDIFRQRERIENLEKDIYQLRKASNSSEILELRKQLQDISAKLTIKHNELEKSRALITTLELRLSDAIKRYTIAENQIQARYNLAGTFDSDIESNNLNKPKDMTKNMLLSSRATVIQSSISIQRVVFLIDKILFLFATFLRSNPIPRMVFAMYLIFIHIWVFVVLCFHATHLDEESGKNMLGN